MWKNEINFNKQLKSTAKVVTHEDIVTLLIYLISVLGPIVEWFTYIGLWPVLWWGIGNVIDRPSHQRPEAKNA